MPLREYYLGDIALSPQNRRLKEKELHQLIRNKRHNVEDSCPILTRLHVCKLEVMLESTNRGMRLHFYLEEYINPHVMIFDGNEHPKIAVNDYFNQDIRSALNALRNVRSQILTAMNPNAHRDIPPVLCEQDLRRLRRVIARNRGNQIELPGMNAETIDIPFPPKTLPAGTEVQFIANVWEMKPTTVVLNGIRLLSEEGGVDASDFDGKVSMKRPKDGPQSGEIEILRRAMDYKIPIKIDAVVVKEWSTFGLLELRLVKAYDYQLPAPESHKDI